MPGGQSHGKSGCEELGFGAICAYTDSLAILFIIFVGLVAILSFGLHFLEHWIKQRFAKPSKVGLGAALLDAVSRIKEEFMITGLIALLLFAFGHKLESVTCIEFAHHVKSSPEAKNDTSVGSHLVLKEPEPLSVSAPAGEHGRRLMSESSNCLKSRLPFLDQEHAHILLLLAALVNALYSTLTIVIIMRRIAGWGKMEAEMHKSAELLPIGDGTAKRITRAHIRALLGCFFRQFFVPGVWKGVAYDSYHSARQCAMEYWKVMLCKQMLLKSQDQTLQLLQHRLHTILEYDTKQPRGQTEQLEVQEAKVTELVDVVNKGMQRTHELAEASLILSKAASHEHHKKPHAVFSHAKQAAPDRVAEGKNLSKDFERSYRIKVKQFDYIGFVQLLAAEQFSEDRTMAFIQPLVIGLLLLLPHKSLVFAWMPPVVFAVMLILGWELQQILMELTRRYHYLYTEEYHRIKARLRWRNAVAQLVEKQFGPRDWLAKYKHDIPQLPVMEEPKLLRRLSKRATDWHRGERVDSAYHFVLSSPKLMEGVFLFCYYSNSFFLAMVFYTGWIEREEFKNRLGTLMYMGIFSIAAMLHGALNINPIFALITSSSSHVPHDFARKWEEEQHKIRAVVSSVMFWNEETKTNKKKNVPKRRDIES